MASSPPLPRRDLGYYARKYCVAALVLASFAGYALHDRGAYSEATAPAPPTRVAAPIAVAATSVSPTASAPTRPPAAAERLPDGPPPPPTAQARVTPSPTNPPRATAQARPTLTPTLAPAPTAPGGVYRDGTYTGPSVTTAYGPVQVQAVIAGGRIVDVPFLDYPHARRTSIAINSIANPRLVQEAIQIQSAQVHLLSGATLTARGFIASLRGALDQARP